MSEEVIVRSESCFVCGCNLDGLDARSVMDSTNFSLKPIYKFLESFVGKRFHLPISTKASICNTCLEELQEYDKICKRAAKIQEHIADIFKKTQKKFRLTKDFIKCETCFAQFISQDALDKHECIIDEEEEDETNNFIECVDEEDENYSEAGTSKEKKRVEYLIYTCNTCNKSFDRKKEYNSHVKLAHLPEGSQVFNCTVCDASQDNIFVSELELKLHNVIKHPVDKDAPLQCPACPKYFTKKALLARHFGLHSQDKPLICDICGKRYFHTSSFHMHMVVHRGIKTHTCNQCGRAFMSTSHLNRHLKTHTGIKNYECHECGSRFAQRYNLKAHLNIHYGIARKKKPKQPLEYEEGLDFKDDGF